MKARLRAVKRKKGTATWRERRKVKQQGGREESQKATDRKTDVKAVSL